MTTELEVQDDILRFLKKARAVSWAQKTKPSNYKRKFKQQEPDIIGQYIWGQTFWYEVDSPYRRSKTVAERERKKKQTEFLDQRRRDGASAKLVFTVGCVRQAYKQAIQSQAFRRRQQACATWTSEEKEEMKKKDLLKELCKREAGKEQINIAQMGEAIAILEDMMLQDLLEAWDGYSYSDIDILIDGLFKQRGVIRALLMSAYKRKKEKRMVQK